MKRILSLTLAGLLAFSAIITAAIPAAAQTTSATVVAACGTPPATYTAGANRALTQDTTGKLCDGASGGVTGTVTANEGATNAGGVLGWAIRLWDAAGNALTSTTVSAKQALDVNVAQTVATPAGANIIGKVGIDQTTPGTTNGVQVNAALPAGTNTLGTIGGLEFNASAIPTVQNAAYAAGQSLGGLQTISVGATNSLTGILTQVSIASSGGSTVAVVAYVWDKNPTGTTCTDKANFVKSQTDNQHLITGAPILLTPALVVSAQDTSTYASAGNLVDNFVNSSTNTNLYACVLANAAVTPPTTSDYRFNLQGVKDQP